MKIAFAIFDGMTTLDFIGIFEPLTRLRSMGFTPDLSWDICGRTESVTDASGFSYHPDAVNTSLGTYDGVIIPGGMATRELSHDESFIAWIATSRASRWIATVCTGSLLIGAAGFLKDRNATTHPGAIDLLKDYAKNVLPDRIVDTGSIITAGGVASSIDLGLYLCERMAGEEARKAIQKQMDYRCYPPPDITVKDTE